MMPPDDSAKVFSRRAMVLGFSGLCVFGTLGVRLYRLQVTHAEDYRVLSEKNRFNFTMTIPERGRILDRYGNTLAINQQDFRLVIVPERVEDLESTFERIDSIVPLSLERRKRIVADIKRSPKFVPIMVSDHLDWGSFAALNLELPDLPGAIPQEGSKRYYPYEGVFSHLIGYVGVAGPKDVAKDKDALLRQPTFRIGKSGIEQTMDKTLRGKAGRKKVEVNAVGRIVREWDSDKVPAAPGDDVWLTLDADLQVETAKQFGDDSGGAALMDVHTGELRVLLSMPSFDGNQFVSGLTPQQMKDLNSDPRRPQFNKVIGGAYPPASTFKMAVLLAAMKHNVIGTRESVFCTGKTHVGNRDFHCWEPKGHGLINMHEALKQSCDVYFYEIVQRLGMEKIKGVAEELGFEQTFDLGLTGQVRGIVPTDAWKRARMGSGWRTGDSLNASIGQGFVLATPLQLAVMCARIANGIQKIEPTLIVGKTMPKPDSLSIDPNHIAFVQAAMRGVIYEPGGTAYEPGKLGLGPSVEHAGKTGTGQVRGISATERASRVRHNRELPWRLRDHKLFVAYAPYDKPRFAASVVVEHSGANAKRAIDICTKLLASALRKDGIASTQEAGAN